MNIRRLGVGEDAAVVAAGHLLDHRVDAEATARFLADPNDHLLIAYDDAGRPVGFVTGVETTHPDKGTEMFLYELGVDESARRQGIGRALVEALAALARERGCYGMFVLTNDDNVAAMASYRSAGGSTSSPQVMLEWDLRGEASPNYARRGNSA
jgi:ribosomal protein S18 acetylase RimI-like enzyme